ncbi:DUF418 domain-containing protein [Parabacteroides sp. AM58-2XD]|uniref:DUF418 domain-containing protein n=1 Tax=Parabacteroides TaxID=375288 RepID=UPI000FE1FFAD|nr:MULTISPECIES: DUF418 domain-containing protein [Parabacteroides]MCM0721898.1 DUF418 domain-containing protein [Parabacteroides sp. W1-Q-101]RGY93315.1 DUF418 domain-containing protein [Parabacteroides sp. AM58-2XD]
MKHEMPLKSARIEVVDALRGFAVMAIMFLHNIEHFNFYEFPETVSAFVRSLDKNVWDTLFFLFAGKAYAIFSLLFGFSFFTQHNNQAKKGKDFRLRFLWRLFLLFLIGCFNGAFFPGDILVLYAIVGVVLILVCRWSDKAVLITAVILMLQPLEWGKFFYALNNPEYVAAPGQWLVHHKNMYPYLSQPDFLAMVKSNLWDGQLFSLLWGWGHGRFFQTASLFLLGMLLGRCRYFANLAENRRFWLRTLLVGVVCFIPLYYLTAALPDLLTNKSMLAPMNTIISSFRNFAFMCVLVAGFVFFWQQVSGYKILGGLVPYGKMSLTNYLTQSIVGTFIYFGYGLGLYKYLGVTASFGVGILLFILQLGFCHWWLKNHKQGPFEGAWRKATWIFS